MATVALQLGSSCCKISLPSGPKSAQVAACLDGERIIPVSASNVEGALSLFTQSSFPQSTCSTFLKNFCLGIEEDHTLKCGDEALEITLPSSRLTSEFCRRLVELASEIWGKKPLQMGISLSASLWPGRKQIEDLFHTIFPDINIWAISQAEGAIAHWAVARKAVDATVAVLEIGTVQSALTLHHVERASGSASLKITPLKCEQSHTSPLFSATTADEVIGVLIKQHAEKKFRTDEFSKKSLAKLRAQSPALKRTLSQSPAGHFCIESFYDGMDLGGSVQRNAFERGLEPRLDSFLKSEMFQNTQASQLIVIGATVKIPIVARKVKEAFAGVVEVIVPEAPEEAGAVGASLLGVGAALEEQGLFVAEALAVQGLDETVEVVRALQKFPFRIELPCRGSGTLKVIEAGVRMLAEVGEVGEVARLLAVGNDAGSEISISFFDAEGELKHEIKI